VEEDTCHLCGKVDTVSKFTYIEDMAVCSKCIAKEYE
jgi:hypothetical protein